MCKHMQSREIVQTCTKMLEHMRACARMCENARRCAHIWKNVRHCAAMQKMCTRHSVFKALCVQGTLCSRRFSCCEANTVVCKQALFFNYLFCCFHLNDGQCDSLLTLNIESRSYCIMQLHAYQNSCCLSNSEMEGNMKPICHDICSQTLIIKQNITSVSVLKLSVALYLLSSSTRKDNVQSFI